MRFKSREDEVVVLKFLKIEAQCDIHNIAEAETCVDNHTTKKHKNGLIAMVKRWDKSAEKNKKTFLSLSKATPSDKYRYNSIMGMNVSHIQYA